MALTPLASVDRSTFRWLRNRDHPVAFSLLSGDSTAATLEWRHKEGSLATARSSSDEWTLKRGGFLNPHITVRSGDAVRARLSVHLNHHQIDLPGGRSYRFHRAGVLIPAWQVTSSAGKEVLHVEPAREGRHLEAGAVVVAPDAMDLPELLLLVVLSWYFIVLAWFEDEAVETLAPFEGPDSPATHSS
ncbi:MAG: hypothetical protein ABSE66_06760 [Thermoplasmata archaeon]|jgi:hypothetical protein